MDKDFDVIVWGATGFTGALVAEYLAANYGAQGNLRWAIGGRDRSKLEALRGRLKDADDLPIVVADAQDRDAMNAMVARTRTICSTVGPYARYGTKLVAACAEGGTHYCDLTGEVHWMRAMIDQHQASAEQSGARIVHCCGFDSIPSDLGVYFIQQHMKQRHGVTAKTVKCRAAQISGGFSGGTVASMLDMMAEAEQNPEVRRIVADPYALNPEGEHRGADGLDFNTPRYDPDFKAWCAPFVMAAINTRVVRRTNALLGYPYGHDFSYDEAMLLRDGPLGFAQATGVSTAMSWWNLAAGWQPVREFAARFLPKPGEGPDEKTREAGSFELLLLGLHPDEPAKNVRGRVTGDRDPGYGSTSKMIAESAVALALDDLSVGGGFWTPASALGDALLERLPSHAGVEFSVEN